MSDKSPTRLERWREILGIVVPMCFVVMAVMASVEHQPYSAMTMMGLALLLLKTL